MKDNLVRIDGRGMMYYIDAKGRRVNLLSPEKTREELRDLWKRSEDEYILARNGKPEETK